MTATTAGKGRILGHGHALRQKSLVFNHQATVGHHGDRQSRKDGYGIGADDAGLHPEDPGQGDQGCGLAGMSRAVFRSPEQIHDVDGAGNVGQTGIGRKPPDGLAYRWTGKIVNPALSRYRPTLSTGDPGRSLAPPTAMVRQSRRSARRALSSSSMGAPWVFVHEKKVYRPRNAAAHGAAKGSIHAPARFRASFP